MTSFEKYVGAGNDFIIVEQKNISGSYSSFAQKVCDRHRGVGADGLLAASVKNGIPVMDYYNADGSSAAFCGNGLRCFAAWWAKKTDRVGEWFSVQTACGLRRVRVKNNTATVEMGLPIFLPCPKLEVADCRKMLLVLMNVPHLVLFFDGALPDPAQLGPKLEHHPAFAPQGVNVNFVSQREDGTSIKTWERGCGHTPACGTGCCATAAAAGLLPGAHLQLQTDGGILTVKADSTGRLWLQGEAKRVCAGCF